MTGTAWTYRAATPTGELVEGVVQAATSREAIEELRRQSLLPVEVTAAPAPGRRGLGASRADALATAMRTMAVLVGGGASVERALRFAATHAAHAAVAGALEGARTDVLAGQSLSAAFDARREVCGGLAAAMVRAGEESGTLDQALARLADHLDDARELRTRLQGALLYPALLGVAAGTGVVVLLAFVVPRFVGMLQAAGGTLPWSTRLLVGLAEALARFGAVALGGLLLLALGVRWWVQDPVHRAQWHAWRLQLPLVGEIERRVWAARFTRTMGVLLAGGTPVLTALRIAREGIGNAALVAQLDRAAERVARGDRVAATLEGTLPPLAVQLLAVGEEGATLPAMAARAADALDGEVRRALQQAVALLEPVLIVAFGGLVGFIALAMLQAIYSINASVT